MEILIYTDFPFEHWTRIRTNNVIKRLNREIRRRTRVVGCFPDGNSALMLVPGYGMLPVPSAFRRANFSQRPRIAVYFPFLPAGSAEPLHNAILFKYWEAT